MVGCFCEEAPVSTQNRKAGKTCVLILLFNSRFGTLNETSLRQPRRAGQKGF